MCFIDDIAYDHIPEINEDVIIFYTDEQSKILGLSIKCKCFCHLSTYFKSKIDGLYNYNLGDYSLHISKYGKAIHISITPIPQDYDKLKIDISLWWCLRNTLYTKAVIFYWLMNLKVLWLIIISIIFLILYFQYNLPNYDGSYMEELFNKI